MGKKLIKVLLIFVLTISLSFAVYGVSVPGNGFTLQGDSSFPLKSISGTTNYYAPYGWTGASGTTPDSIEIWLHVSKNGVKIQDTSWYKTNSTWIDMEADQVTMTQGNPEGVQYTLVADHVAYRLGVKTYTWSGARMPL